MTPGSRSLKSTLFISLREEFGDLSKSFEGEIGERVGGNLFFGFMSIALAPDLRLLRNEEQNYQFSYFTRFLRSKIK